VEDRKVGNLMSFSQFMSCYFGGREEKA
jgi:hypothetical protein